MKVQNCPAWAINYEALSSLDDGPEKLALLEANCRAMQQWLASSPTGIAIVEGVRGALLRLVVRAYVGKDIGAELTRDAVDRLIAAGVAQRPDHLDNVKVRFWFSQDIQRKAGLVKVAKRGEIDDADLTLLLLWAHPWMMPPLFAYSYAAAADFMKGFTGINSASEETVRAWIRRWRLLRPGFVLKHSSRPIRNATTGKGWTPEVL